MTTAAEFADFLADICPAGALVQPCREDGTPLRGPGRFTRFAAAIVTAPAELDALVRVRFGPPPGAAVPPGSVLDTYTTDPWAQLPSGSWVAPDLDASGRQLGWLRIIPTIDASSSALDGPTLEAP